MKKYLFIYALCLTALVVCGYRRHRTEINRLRQNQSALTAHLTHYRTQWGAEAATAQVLRLRCAEFEELRAADAERIRRLGIRLRHVESTAQTATTTQIEIAVPIRDTIVLRDTQQLFRWRDPWVSVEGLIAQDSVRCRVESVDTLHQIIHRIPHRFLFFRWGCKAIRQEIVSANPHTRIVHAEYVKIER